MKEEDKIELYLKGYEEGQKDAWSDIESMISKYEGWELRSRIESKRGTLNNDIDAKRAELKEKPEKLVIEDGPDLDDKEKTSRNIPWGKGDAYLFVEKRPDASLRELSYVMDKGASALIIVRQSPDKLIDKYEIPKDRSKFIWLSRSGGGMTMGDLDVKKISPSDLSGLSNEIGRYLKENPKSVIFISGLALMTNYSESNNVLKLLNFSRDRVTDNDACLVSSVSGDALDDKFLEKIKGDFDRTFG